MRTCMHVSSVVQLEEHLTVKLSLIQIVQVSKGRRFEPCPERNYYDIIYCDVSIHNYYF